ncbi:MAG: PQQ-binding-like beta-propeller repeat protein [Opitutales bacterium]|nr:PQQ-binding-like beta-propeller repeat protein [Opitutales bacterium]MCH8541338.1 PQQ-binding-like beta-propeller repeat protein [Opitutales bacterium]
MIKTSPSTSLRSLSSRLLFGTLLLFWPAASAVGDPTPPLLDIESYFDGSQQGNADEAAVRRKLPEYFHFTLEGLSEFESLERIRISVIPHESHTARKLDMRVLTSQPTPEDEEVQGYDFAVRDEEILSFDFFDSDGNLVPYYYNYEYQDENSNTIEVEVQGDGEGNFTYTEFDSDGNEIDSFLLEDDLYGPDGNPIVLDGAGVVRNITATGWVDVPLEHLSMDMDDRTFRLAFDAGFRGGINMPFIEVTGVRQDGEEVTTLVRYDFDTVGQRAMANTVHADLSASMLTPQGYPLPAPIISVEQSSGDYSAVELHFSIPDAPESFRDWSTYSGLRNNRIEIDQWIRVTAPGGELELDGSDLSGTFERQHRGENPHEVTVSATVDGDGYIDGTATVIYNNPWTGTGESWTGTVSGRITPEAELLGINAIDPDAEWTRFIGPVNAGNTSINKGIRLFEHIDQIRHQWGSEANDIGQGIGSLNRHAWRYTSARKRSGGSSSSPLLADGKVFMYYTVPSPRVYNYVYRAREFTPGHSPFETNVVVMADQGNDNEVFFGGPEDLPDAVLEKIWEAADDVVIAMDAATGKTLWRTRFEGVGYNRQHHKDGPYAQTAAVKDGRIFAIGSGGWLYAMDAETGDHLWSEQVGSEHTHERTSVLALPGIVIMHNFGNWKAFDAVTGETVWENTDISLNDLSLPAHWRTDSGEDYLFVFEDMSTIAMLDATDGTVVSTMALPVPDGYEETKFPPPSRNGNPGNMTVIGDVMITHEQYSNNGNTEGYGMAAYDITTEGLTPRWRHTFEGEEESTYNRIRGEYNPLVMHGTHAILCPDGRGIMTIDIATGEIIEESDNSVNGLPHGNGLMMATEDMLIVQDDMTHGEIRLYFYKVSTQGHIYPISDNDHMPLTTRGTGSYHHPVMQPLADGRLFLRQRDGIHAYDLRDTRDAPEVTEWPEASSIDFGTTLGEVELTSGSASVPGHFAFKRLDSVPEPGTSPFMLVFYPDDSETYHTAETHIMVTVNQVTPEIVLESMGQICPHTAEVNAELQAGDASTEVAVWFGPEDGGATEANWDQVISLGTQSLGSVGTTLSGLSADQTYYYRFVASNPEEVVQTGTDSFQTPALRASLITPTVTDVRIPEGVALILETEISENGDPVTLEWQMASGDGSVTWEDAYAANTAVWFGNQGEYHLQLVLDDGNCIQYLDVSVEVVDPLLLPDGDGAGNIGPMVLAGNDRTISAGSPFEMEGEVADDGLPESPGAVTTEWTLRTAQSGVTINEPNVLSSEVEVSEEGEYVFRLTAFDGEVKTADEVTFSAESSDVLVFITEPVVEGIVGKPYHYEIEIGGGDSELLTLESGALPSWLTLEEGADQRTWTLSGTPGASESDEMFPIQLTASDGTDSQTQSFDLRIWPEGTVMGMPQIRLRPIASVEPYSADLRAALLGGEEPLVVHLWYGLSDGEDDESAWDTVVDFGVMEFGDIAHLLDELDDQTTYYYRFIAENMMGQQMTETESFDTPKDLTDIHPQITLVKPLSERAYLPEGVGLVLETLVEEIGGESGQLSLEWEQVGGSGSVTWEDSSAAETVAWFDSIGEYDIRLTADNGENADVLEMTILVVDPSLVNDRDPIDPTPLVSYHFSEDTGDADSVASNHEASAVTGNNITISFDGSGHDHAQPGEIHVPVPSQSENNYLTFTLETSDGSDLDMSSLTFKILNLRDHNSRNARFAIRSSLDSFTDDMEFHWEREDGSVSDEPVTEIFVGWGYGYEIREGVLIDADLRGHETTGSITFRIYPSRTGSLGSSMALDDIVIDAYNMGNIGPLVEAGADQTVNADEEVTLSGTVDDDGYPIDPGMVTTEWSQLSGPTVSLSDAMDLSPTFTPSENGPYVFRLVAFDGEVATVNDTTVTVDGEGAATTPFEDWLNEYDLEGRDLDDPEDGVMKAGRMVSLREAFLLGEHPHDPNDIVRVTEIQPDKTEGTMRVYFPSLPDRVYTIELSDDLQAESWSRYGEVSVAGDGEVWYFTVPMDTVEHQRRFFRVRVHYPE